MYEHPDRVRLPPYRGRLLVAAMVSCAAVGPIVIGLGPILVGLLRDTWHVGCTEFPMAGGRTGWGCPDGVSYLLPGLLFAASLAGLCFGVAAVRIVRNMSGRAPEGEVRRAAARDLAWLGAGPLVLQTPFSVVAGLSAMTSFAVLLLGLVVGAAGLGPFLAQRRPPLFAMSCALAAAAALLMIRYAVLLTPVIAGCAILLLTAIAVVQLGEPRPPRGGAPAAPTSSPAARPAESRTGDA